MIAGPLIELFIEEHGEELDKYIYHNLFHKEYFDDLKQEVYLKLCELNVCKLIELYKEDKILNYSKQIVINMFITRSQPFHKTIKFVGCDFEPPDIIDEEYIYGYPDVPELYNYQNDFWLELYKYSITKKIPISTIGRDLKFSRETITKQFNRIKQGIKDKYGDKKIK